MFFSLHSTVGPKYSTEAHFEIAKYHAQLIHDGVQVTMPMLYTRWVELHGTCGLTLTERKRKSQYLTRFLGNCRLLRFAKCQKFNTDKTSLQEVRPILNEIMRNEEPVSVRSINFIEDPQCTCSPHMKVSNYVMPCDEIFFMISIIFIGFK